MRAQLALAVVGCVLNAILLGSGIATQAGLGAHEALHCYFYRLFDGAELCYIEIYSNGTGVAWVVNSSVYRPWEHTVIYAIQWLSVTGILLPGMLMTIPFIRRLKK